MRRTLATLALHLLLASAAPAQQPTHKIETTDRQTVNATITYEIRTTNFAVSKWMMFLPEPPELPSQTKVKTTATPVGRVVTDKSALGRKVRYVEVPVAAPKAGGTVSLKLEVEAVLRARKLVPLAENEVPPVVAPLTATERKYYLSATTLVDHDATAFREWLGEKKLHRVKDESAIDFAARVLEVIRSDYRYRFDTDTDKRASVACRAKVNDCGGLSYLFVGAMRANDTPARLLVGRLAVPRKPGSDPSQTDYDQPHIRAEMFVAGVGWVPVEPAYAHVNRRRPVSAFVGFDPGDLLVLHVDVDFQLPFPDKAREVQVLQIGPAYWTAGKGTFDGHFGPTGWDLKTTPINK